LLETSFSMEEMALNLMKMHEYPLLPTPAPLPGTGSIMSAREAY
jgi:hypothetical protein